jgi:proteasome lid subunit RPN8/RPN11
VCRSSISSPCGSRVNDRSVSLRDAGRGRPGTTAESRDTHVRAPFPSDQAVLWVPRRGPAPEPPTPDGPYELVFQREVLKKMSRHATGDIRESRFGFLLGRLHRCPDSGVHYALVDTVLQASEEFVEEAPGAYLLRAWADAQPEFRRHPGVLVGWYHSHRLLGLLLSEGDMDANRRYFNEAWQCCVLFAPDESRPLGSVFRPGIQESSRKSPDPAAFWEVRSQDESPNAGPPALDWTNYEIRQESLGSGRPSPEQDRTAASRAGPLPVSPTRGVSGSSTSPVSLVIPAESSDSQPQSPRRRIASWTTVFAFVAIVALVAIVASVGLRSNAPPPVTRPTIQRPVRPAVSPDLTRFREIAAELRTSIDRYDERARDFDLGRIGCDLLTTGYGVVDASFIQFVAVRAQLDAGQESEPALEFDRLSEEVDDVNGHFDASGCPRPE